MAAPRHLLLSTKNAERNGLVTDASRCPLLEGTDEKYTVQSFSQALRSQRRYSPVGWSFVSQLWPEPVKVGGGASVLAVLAAVDFGEVVLHPSGSIEGVSSMPRG